MKIRTIYVSEDGLEFATEEECLRHEEATSFEKIRGQIFWWDWYGEAINPVWNGATYSRVSYIKIETIKAAKLLANFCKIEGFHCPCADEDGNLNKEYLGNFWYDYNIDEWHNVAESRRKLDEIELKMKV
jgi:hypothetical protein